MDPSLEARIRLVLKQHGRLARDADQLGRDDDLYQAGLSSHGSVNVMLALEAEFDLEFPDRLLTRSSFQSVGAIGASLSELVQA